MQGLRRFLLIAAMIMMIAACMMAPLRKGPVDITKIPDGVYVGTAGSWLNQADVRVTVRGGVMTDILLTRHWASWIGRKAEPVVPKRIIEKQSPDVDAVTGATSSSRVIMHAVYNALEQGVRKSAEAPP